MEVTYRRNLHKSYMCVKGQEEIAEEYELNMIKAEHVPYLLELEVVESDGEKNYLYDISGKQQMEDYLSGKKMGYEMLWKLLSSVRELCNVLPDYLLRENGICLKEEYIYVNLGDGSLSFTYLPFWNESLQDAFARCMEQILRKIDHQDQAATELAYQIYQLSLMENISIRKMLENITVKKEQKTESSECGREFQEAVCENSLEQKAEDAEQKAGKRQYKILSGIWKMTEQEPWLYTFFQYFQPDHAQKKASGEKSLKEENGNGKSLREVICQKKFTREKLLKEKFIGENLLKERFIKEKPSQERLIKEKPSQERLIKEKPSQGRLIKEKSLQGRFIKEKPSIEVSGNGKLMKENPFQIREDDIFGEKMSGERELSYPTEILGADSQEPMGKLIYQGHHGCGDILVEGEDFLLGKNRRQAAGVIDAEGISRIHARISKREGAYYLEDLNSTNGTYLNGEPVAYHQKRKLSKNDRILFAAEEYLFS